LGCIPECRKSSADAEPENELSVVDPAHRHPASLELFEQQFFLDTHA
jgi:hypothetical protein